MRVPFPSKLNGKSFLVISAENRLGPVRFGTIFVRPKRLQYLSVATLFWFVARFARVRIEKSSRNRFVLNDIQGIACFIVYTWPKWFARNRQWVGLKRFLGRKDVHPWYISTMVLKMYFYFEGKCLYSFVPKQKCPPDRVDNFSFAFGPNRIIFEEKKSWTQLYSIQFVEIENLLLWVYFKLLLR